MYTLEYVLHHFLKPVKPSTDCHSFSNAEEKMKNNGKLLSWPDSPLRLKQCPRSGAVTCIQEGNNLDEFSRYDRSCPDETQEVSKYSPPPSYDSQSSVTEEISYETNGKYGLNQQLSVGDEGKFICI